MKNIFAVALFALILIGCDNNNPANETSADVEYNELSMYKSTVATDGEVTQLKFQNAFHDSLRHGRMLGTLIRHVGLTEEQVVSVKEFGQTMFETLKEIRTQVHDSVITREEARELVIAAREQFVVSVKSILTEEQLVKFDEWILKFWNKRHGRPAGRGGHFGPGGPGGHRP